MSARITHDEAQEALGAAALGALPTDERERVAAHAAHCAACAADLAALRATAARLGEARADVALDGGRSAALRERLVRRAAAERADGGRTDGERAVAAATPLPGRVEPVRPLRSAAAGGAAAPAAAGRGGWWLALAASVAAVAAGVEVVRLRAERAALSEAVATRAAEVRTLRSAVADREQALTRLTGADVQVVELASSQATSPTARMFWDRASNSWLLYAHRLPPAGPGRTYQLGLVTPTEKISAGTFDTSPNGDAVVRTSYPLSREQLTAVAVTEEPAGGVPVATGPVVLLGAATR